MNSSIYYKLEVIVRVLPELTANTVSKTPVVFKVFFKKILEFDLCHQDFSLRATFMLILILYNQFLKKQGDKKNAVGPISPGNVKIVFTLLAKLVAIYMRVSIIEIRKPNFEKLFARARLLVLL